MSDARTQMDKALKSVVVPALRATGFKGTYPNFYREIEGHIDLLSFQFRLSGGSFVAELSFAEPNRNNVYIYKETAPNKLRPSQTTKRIRLGAKGEGTDHWFSYEASDGKPSPDFEGITKQVLSLLGTQAEPWWHSHREHG